MNLHFPPEVAGWLARAGILAFAAIAGIMTLGLVASMLVAPAMRNASGSVAVGLALPAETALPVLDQRSVVYAADGTVLAILHDEVDRRVVPLDAIPQHLRRAVLTAEDRKFYEHEGYDVEGIGRAVVANARARGIAQGGSTITQQLAKQNFLTGEQTFERKFSELLHAVALEDEFTKEELLERYLNQVYFGAGAYGVAAAAEEYFGSEPEALEPHQSALLAAIIRSPGALNPRTNPDGVLARRDAVLRDMELLGYLSAEEAAAALAQPVEVRAATERDVREPYVVEAVKREFFDNAAFGETRQERVDRLFTGGLHIHTTLDPRLQAIADEVVREQFPSDSGPTAAIAAVDPRDGRVLALQSGDDFSLEQFDLATQGRRQPGSAFKPFVMATALEAGFPLRMTLQGTSPAYFEGICGWARENPAGCNAPTDRRGVRNYGGSSYGRVDLRQALVRSVNTAFAQLIQIVGVEEVIALAGEMGIDAERGIGDDVGPAISLGGLEFGATPLEMASAYSPFANGGKAVRPFVMERVLGADGEEIFRAQPAAEEVLRPVVAAAMTDVMKDVVRFGTATGAHVPGWDAAGKTGTTQNNADAWFVGYVPVMSAAVWVGHPEGQVSMPGMTGGSVPARLWQRFMTRALEDQDAVPFPDADGDLSDVIAGESVTVPNVIGMSETAALTALGGGKLIGEGRSTGSQAAAGSIVWQSPRPGATARPGDTVFLGVSLGRSTFTTPGQSGGGGGSQSTGGGGQGPSGGSLSDDDDDD